MVIVSTCCKKQPLKPFNKTNNMQFSWLLLTGVLGVSQLLELGICTT